MKEINVMTIAGVVQLSPGDKFQAHDRKHNACLYQYLGMMKDEFGRTVYLHDETNDKFMNVSYGWFALKLILVLKEEEL